MVLNWAIYTASKDHDESAETLATGSDPIDSGNADAIRRHLEALGQRWGAADIQCREILPRLWEARQDMGSSRMLLIHGIIDG